MHLDEAFRVQFGMDQVYSFGLVETDGEKRRVTHVGLVGEM